MAKGGNKNATKSFAMLIVTGIVLVAVTLCWFAINKNSAVERVRSSTGNNASTSATLYVGKTADGEIAITSDADNKKRVVKYEKTESVDDAIVLENMIPGAEYFFKVEFKTYKGEYDVVLSLNDIVDNGLKDAITVYSRLTTSADTTIHPNGQNPKDLQAGNFVEEKITYEGETSCVIYFSFKFSEKATIENYSNKSVEIGKWDAVISKSISETTSSETT